MILGASAMAAGRKSEAFTLVELLVVISIIALLMAILVPALHRARGKAHQVWCMNTLRNFSLAHKLYLHETGTYLQNTSRNPYTPWYNNDAFRRALGLQAVSREDKKRRSIGTLQEWKPNVPRSLICPAATYALKHPEDGLYPIDRSFGVNVDGDYWAWIQGVSNYADKEGWVKNPSEKIFMADALDWWISYFYCEKYFEFGETWVGFDGDGGTYGMTAYRHYDRTDIMYWDGHCGQLSSEEVAHASDPNYLWNPLY